MRAALSLALLLRVVTLQPYATDESVSPPALAPPFALHPRAAAIPSSGGLQGSQLELVPRWFRRLSLTAGYSVTLQLEMETPRSFRVRSASETPLSDDALRSLLATAAASSGNWTRRSDGEGGMLLPLREYQATLRKLRALSGIRVEPPPPRTLAALRHMPPSPGDAAALARLRARLPHRMRTELCPFQLAGVDFLISRRRGARPPAPERCAAARRRGVGARCGDAIAAGGV